MLLFPRFLLSFDVPVVVRPRSTRVGPCLAYFMIKWLIFAIRGQEAFYTDKIDFRPRVEQLLPTMVQRDRRRLHLQPFIIFKGQSEGNAGWQGIQVLVHETVRTTLWCGSFALNICRNDRVGVNRPVVVACKRD